MSSLQTTWHHLRRSPFQSLAAIIIIWLCFFIATTFFIISDGLATVLHHFETKPEITIFLKDGLDKAAIEDIQKELTNYPNIREIKYISKEKALSLYREQNKDNPLLLEMVTSSILPASFEISVSDPQALSSIADNFAPKKDLIDEIIYQKDAIQSLLHWTQSIRQFGLITVATLALVAFIIIFVLISLKVTNRKEEIRISRLLGASKYYVKKPFLLEGMIYGGIGSIFGWLSSFSLAFYFRSSINHYFQPILFIKSDWIYYFQALTFELLFGLILGYLASWFSTRRLIKY
jgi:cell division transport system permease protein